MLILLDNVQEDTSRLKIISELANQYFDTNNFNKAKEYCEEAITIGKTINSQSELARQYSFMGRIYRSLGQPNEAIKSYIQSLKILEALNDKKNVAPIFGSVGLAYQDQGNYDMALKYYKESLNEAKKINEEGIIQEATNNIGAAYYHQENYDSAKVYFLSALSIREKSGNKFLIANSLTNLGLVSMKKKSFEQALAYYNRSMKIFEEIDRQSGIANTFNNIGDVYFETGKYNLAEEQYLKSLSIASRMNDKERIIDNYSDLAKTFAVQKKFDRAYEWAQLEKKASALYYNTESSKQIAEMQAKYETDKKEKENKLLAQRNQIQELEIKQEKEKRNVQFIILIGALIFTISIALLSYNRYRFKQKAIMEAEINRQQKLRFKEVMNAEEKERRRIAQELHDGLGQLLSTVKLNIAATENFIDDSGKTPLKNSLSLLDNACDEVRTISHNMVPSVLIRLGLLPALRELIRKINQSKGLIVNMKVDFEEHFDESIEVAIYRIVQEVLNNIIKHAQAKGVTVKLHKEENDFSIRITDDGIGFDTALIEKSEGIGWKNIYSRAAMLNGTVDVISAPSAGMTVKIYFPKLFSHI